MSLPYYEQARRRTRLLWLCGTIIIGVLASVQVGALYIMYSTLSGGVA